MRHRTARLISRSSARPAFVPLALLSLASCTAPEAEPPVASLDADGYPSSGYRAEFFQVLASAEDDFVALAEAMPEELFAWRPGEGVRSYAEVCLHIAQTNFTGPRMIGVEPPPAFDPDGYEQSLDDKAAIVAQVRQSFDHLRSAVLSISDADQDIEIQGWYGPSTYRGALHIMNEHLGEHLGQSIAYARVNGVIPPWNR